VKGHLFRKTLAFFLSYYIKYIRLSVNMSFITYHFDGGIAGVVGDSVVSDDVRLRVVELGVEDIALLSHDDSW